MERSPEHGTRVDSARAAADRHGRRQAAAASGRRLGGAARGKRITDRRGRDFATTTSRRSVRCPSARAARAHRRRRASDRRRQLGQGRRMDALLDVCGRRRAHVRRPHRTTPRVKPDPDILLAALAKLRFRRAAVMIGTPRTTSRPRSGRASRRSPYAAGGGVMPIWPARARFTTTRVTFSLTTPHVFSAPRPSSPPRVRFRPFILRDEEVTGAGASAAARTRGARCSRSGSARRSGHRRG